VSHRVSLEGEVPVHSEQTVRESERVEPETVPHCDTVKKQSRYRPGVAQSVPGS
jgi:hypothetical protein